MVLKVLTSMLNILKYTLLKMMSERTESGVIQYILEKEIFILIPKKNNFYAHKTLPCLVDRKKYSPKCGMAICYSCNNLYISE